MARVVLLSFTSNEAAEAFVRMTAESGLGVQIGEDGMTRVEATVEAVVGRPVNWCKCALNPDTSSRRRRGRKSLSKGRSFGWSRGKTYGWWLCPTCHRPSRPIVEHFITTMLAGNNDLLPKILDPEQNPISPHERWLRDGGTEAEYDRGMPGPGRTRRHV